MAYSVTFAALTAPQMGQLDTVFTQVGNLGIIPAAVSGTNTLTLTPVAGVTPNITAYFDGLTVSAVAVATNTTATAAQVGSLASLNVYKDGPTGPIACIGGEIVLNCSFTLRYDSALNTGTGGWHLRANTPFTRMVTAAGTLTFTVVPANLTQEHTLAVPGAQINDVVQVGPPASLVTGTNVTGYVKAAGTVGVVVSNPTAASLTPTSGIYRVAVTGFT